MELICKLNHCPDPGCPGHTKTKSPELEITIAPPHWAIGWDVFCWIGHRRFARPSSISQSQADLRDDDEVKLSDDAIAPSIRRDQVSHAARQQDPEALRQHDESAEKILLSLDGLPPEKGPETLSVVRERTGKRGWFAEALISATADEVRRRIAQAKEGAASLGKPVAFWISDRPDACVTGIAAEFPGGPPRSCDHHGLRDVAKPVLEAESHAKVPMRKKGRGLRKIEPAVLKDRPASGKRTSRQTTRQGPSRRPPCPRTQALPERIPRARSCWIIAWRCAGSSTTTKGTVPSSRLADGGRVDRGPRLDPTES